MRLPRQPQRPTGDDPSFFFSFYPSQEHRQQQRPHQDPHPDRLPRAARRRVAGRRLLQSPLHLPQTQAQADYRTRTHIDVGTHRHAERPAELLHPTQHHNHDHGALVGRWRHDDHGAAPAAAAAAAAAHTHTHEHPHDHVAHEDEAAQEDNHHHHHDHDHGAHGTSRGERNDPRGDSADGPLEDEDRDGGVLLYHPLGLCLIRAVSLGQLENVG
mmetsp:Transcript_34243/g.84780  ORF Transcript_34243/g.84780 Transcript_34243/m.84780 type:complete len:214 (+) Transcript_34243:1803-2444(+)